jgi:RNase P subunit RPR2
METVFMEGGNEMNSEALDTLPVVVCPGCEEPMQPKGNMPVTRELYDISYICPKCGAKTKRTLKRA